MQKAILIFALGLSLSANESYYDRGVLVELQSSKETRALSSGDMRYFRSKSGRRVGVKDEVLLKCKANVDCSLLLKKRKQGDVTRITSSIYKVRVKEGGDVFALSRELFESGDVEFAHPSFTREVSKR